MGSRVEPIQQKLRLDQVQVLVVQIFQRIQAALEISRLALAQQMEVVFVISVTLSHGHLPSGQYLAPLYLLRFSSANASLDQLVGRPARAPITAFLPQPSQKPTPFVYPQKRTLPSLHTRADRCCHQKERSDPDLVNIGKCPKTSTVFALKLAHLPPILHSGTRVSWESRSTPCILEWNGGKKNTRAALE